MARRAARAFGCRGSVPAPSVLDERLSVTRGERIHSARAECVTYSRSLVAFGEAGFAVTSKRYVRWVWSVTVFDPHGAAASRLHTIDSGDTVSQVDRPERLAR
jgi:hypothetical protein